MPPKSTLDNKGKWKKFLSSIKQFKDFPTNNFSLNEKPNKKNLSTQFANLLLQTKGDANEKTGSPDVFDKSKHLNVQNSERNSPYSSCDHLVNLSNVENQSPATGYLPKEPSVLPLDKEKSSGQIFPQDSHIESIPKTFNELNIQHFSTNMRVPTSSCVDNTLEDPIPKRISLSEENKNDKKQDCFGVALIHNFNTKSDNISDTAIKKNLQESEDEDGSSLSSIISEVEVKENTAETKNFDEISVDQQVKTFLPESEDGDESLLSPNILRGNDQFAKHDFKNDDSDSESMVLEVEVKENATETKTIDQISVDQQVKILNEIKKPSSFTKEKDDSRTNNNVKHGNDKTIANKPLVRQTRTPIKACSEWKVQDIAEYFIFDDCVEIIKVPDDTPSLPDEVYKFILKDVMGRLEKVKGTELTHGQHNEDSKLITLLKLITITESGSRLILDAVLIALCSELGIQIELEKTFKSEYLPNCRFDYCLKKEQRIIGCVEAKSIRTFSASSVAQALMELIILQAITTANDTDSSSDTPVFAIISDGRRFIYIRLRGYKFEFEKNDAGKLRIREARTENDFKQIMQHLKWLIRGDDA